ncbi:hypothetical protein EVAR_62984_1 [Eumeta japonica]|uniref:Uncharacterized protein n=1 Tax=Eumeta variegata TaxID=151549 RepID=A0A4C1ZL01_EUMVA|nr:hypothetical protein EVAR_62984_1 [Eumeta japonica]
MYIHERIKSDVQTRKLATSRSTSSRAGDVSRAVRADYVKTESKVPAVGRPPPAASRTPAAFQGRDELTNDHGVGTFLGCITRNLLKRTH